MISFPKRGEIWRISLNPTKGSEIKKTRPCLVLSRDEFNRAAETLTVIPVTSGEVKYPHWEIKVDSSSGLKELCHLVLPQIRVAAKERFKNRIGQINEAQFYEIQEKLLFYLGFDNLFGERFTITGTVIS